MRLAGEVISLLEHTSHSSIHGSSVKLGKLAIQEGTLLDGVISGSIVPFHKTLKVDHESRTIQGVLYTVSVGICRGRQCQG